ncbi:helix-turn-helix domain-containing protein [Actinomycetospora lutea]|uniref:helix-turn-helix domain-containing protein n=1 Tax=Actinomycetospora lutea TaxID=663604 RepID=UPI0023671658|nr:helix-turn-helix domain-containing protein [Actinomycetospora lutea]MDD7942509.1 helix-turn-helix domain-containing protein [Actinomycetospora lutea]
MATTDEASVPRFYSVAEAARILGAAPVTLYRAIRAGEFPAVRIRGRLIVPASALEAMSATTVSHGSLVDAAEWTSQTRGVGR